VLQILLTGVRGAQTGQVTVTIGTTPITGTSITFTGQTNSAGTLMPATDTPGLDTINVALPASLSGAGDVPIVVSVTINGVTFTSRPTTDTPPHITINP
jgi:phage tail sheath gpL-like